METRSSPHPVSAEQPEEDLCAQCGSATDGPTDRSAIEADLEAALDEIEAECGGREVGPGGDASQEVESEWEPSMRDQGGRFDSSLSPGQWLEVTSKLVSLTLLNELRYRVLIKFGFPDRPDLVVSAILHADEESYSPEGDLNKWFDRYYTQVEDPMELHGEERQLWFVCRLAEEWLDRFLERSVLRDTAIWGE